MQCAPFPVVSEIVVKRNKSKTVRRVWRITAEHPHGEVVEVQPPGAAPAPVPTAAPVAAERPAPEDMPTANWRASSYDLLKGLDVTDESDSIPGELFDKLFRH